MAIGYGFSSLSPYLFSFFSGIFWTSYKHYMRYIFLHATYMRGMTSFPSCVLSTFNALFVYACIEVSRNVSLIDVICHGRRVDMGVFFCFSAFLLADEMKACQSDLGALKARGGHNGEVTYAIHEDTEAV